MFCFIGVFECNTIELVSPQGIIIFSVIYSSCNREKQLKLICKKTWYLLKSMQPSCKEGATLYKMARIKKSCDSQKNGCDGRLVTKILLTTIQVNFVPIPSEPTQIHLNCHYFNFYHWSTITAISWPPPVRHNFFQTSHFAYGRTFLQLGCVWVDIMRLSIACPTIPPRTVGGEGWGFDQPKIQMPHCLGKSGDQIFSYPLYLEAIRWGIWSNQRSKSPPLYTGAYFVQNQV